MAEFFFLWDKLQQIQLSDVPDAISWRWTANGSYSSKTAYQIQFRGSFCSFNSSAIWEASAEGKHKLFMWLFVQNRILSADCLLLRSWTCNPVCILCDQGRETAAHLCLHCVFAREVWFLVSNWSPGLIVAPQQGFSTEQWWNIAVQGRPKHIARKVAAILMCTAWNIWKERNPRIFQGVFMAPGQVFFMIKEEMQLREVAMGGRASAV
jgi:hypothetical protein